MYAWFILIFVILMFDYLLIFIICDIGKQKRNFFNIFFLFVCFIYVFNIPDNGETYYFQYRFKW